MEVSGRLHALAALPQGESPQYPLDRRLGGPHSQSGCAGKGKHSLPLEELSCICPAHRLVTVLAKPSQLQ